MAKQFSPKRRKILLGGLAAGAAAATWGVKPSDILTVNSNTEIRILARKDSDQGEKPDSATQ